MVIALFISIAGDEAEAYVRPQDAAAQFSAVRGKNYTILRSSSGEDADNRDLMIKK